MQLSQRSLRVLLALAAVVVLVAAVVVFRSFSGNGGTGTRSTRAAGVSAAEISVSGGVRLAAQIVTPPGAGPFPLVVMPTSWGSDQTEYLKPAQLLADHGFQVVAYAQRGFHDSTGAVDFAGQSTRDDASAVIDWALAHTKADKAHIGMVGISYGAGMSLLTASHDARVRAVVAMSTWSDFADAFLPNDTLSSEALEGLVGSAQKSGTAGPAITGLTSAFSRSVPDGIALLRQMSPQRSPDEVLAGLNRNRPAVMIANNLQDSIFAPAPVVSYFDKITAPKRLQLGVGDHGGAEYGGLVGRTNAVWTDALAWLDHYLRGTSSTITKADPVQLSDFTTGRDHGYRRYPTARTTVRLGAPSPTATVGQTTDPAWTARLSDGVDSAATNGPEQFGVVYTPPTIRTSALTAGQAAVWNGAPLAHSTLFAGTPSLHLRIGGTGAQTTVFTYLYDVSSDGTARLVTSGPETAPTHGGTVSVTIGLEPTCWTVAAGHHVTVVVDTVDPRFTTVTPKGTVVTLSSTAADPATVSLPTG